MTARIAVATIGPRVAVAGIGAKRGIAVLVGSTTVGLGGGGGAALSDANPSPLGAAAPGVDTEASRSDHVHVMPSAADVGAASTGALAAEAAARSAADALLIPLAQKGAAGGVADLDGGGKVPAAQLPAIAISNHLGTVASQAAMLALVGERGDWCTRSDLTADFILIGDDASVLGNWKQLVHPTDAVLSVEGRTGAVTLSDLFAALAHNHDASAVTTGTLADARIPSSITRDAEAVAYAIALG